eukprot:SRR837773.9619.p1 GENE.SRR837773.9619~~SRR837773.9619.p1  ORF type:complete len:152 (+),score=15.25 SRR837773.9619:56-457(+)
MGAHPVLQPTLVAGLPNYLPKLRTPAHPSPGLYTMGLVGMVGGETERLDLFTPRSGVTAASSSRSARATAAAEPGSARGFGSARGPPRGAEAASDAASGRLSARAPVAAAAVLTPREQRWEERRAAFVQRLRG